MIRDESRLRKWCNLALVLHAWVPVSICYANEIAGLAPMPMWLSPMVAGCFFTALILSVTPYLFLEAPWMYRIEEMAWRIWVFCWSLVMVMCVSGMVCALFFLEIVPASKPAPGQKLEIK